MKALQAELPWPPSVNHYWAARGKGRYLSPRARRWTEEAVWALRKARNGHGTVRAPVALYLFAYPPDRRRRDLDNILKAILDALVKAQVLEDDGLVHELHLLRRPPDGQGGRVRLILEAL